MTAKSLPAKKGCFAWEYKGKKKNLDAAYQQLLRYRESLLNPPLSVVAMRVSNEDRPPAGIHS
jgi:hypothetical protein